MSLTVGGFAPARTAPLRGKGGNRGRRDDEVSPPQPVRLVAPVKKVAPAALEWQDRRLPLVGRISAKAWLPSILAACCCVALMYLLQAAGVATTGYEIQRLQALRSDWQLRNEQLEFELAKRRSLTWIEAEATGRLGMMRPEPTALAYVTVRR